MENQKSRTAMLVLVVAILLYFELSIALMFVPKITRRLGALNGFRRRLSETVPEDLTAETMKVVSSAASRAAPGIIEGLKTQGYAIVDNFLQLPSLRRSLRAEAEGYYETGAMELGTSTRFDPITQGMITYNKHNVFSMQLMGGDSYYQGPRLHEYTVAMTKALVPLLAAAFPEANLSPSLVSNKLAVCIGDGSAYDKHYDNSGLDDTRKVTVLYYMNEWREELGGCFRIYQHADTLDVAPQGDRVLVFWSDRLVHSVQPSFAPRGREDHRYALTLWLTSKHPSDITRDDAEVERHFGALLRPPEGGSIAEY